MKKYIVLGGLGFIGSHLVDGLLDMPDTKIVTVIDDLSSGRWEHLDHRDDEVKSGRLVIIEKDFNIQNHPMTAKNFRMDGDEIVYHMAANPDARKGIEDTWLDVRCETILTYKLLEIMRLNGVKKIIFASSGTVYGDSGLTVCKEGVGERLPISLYGAGKVASEALISAFCGTFGFSSVIFRFGNVVGERTTHGAIFDFIKQLQKHPKYLNVLGDGNQSKPYLYVKGVVAGLVHGLDLLNRMAPGSCEPYNLAPSDATSVRFIAEELVRQMGLADICAISYGSTPAGWPGDVPHSRMDMEKLQNTGFGCLLKSDDAVRNAIHQILKTI